VSIRRVICIFGAAAAVHLALCFKLGVNFQPYYCFVFHAGYFTINALSITIMMLTDKKYQLKPPR